MATHIRQGTSAADAADVLDEIAGGLEAEDATAALAPVWNALVARGDALAGQAKAARRLTGRARARLTVIDKRWDRHDGAFGRAALDAAGGKRAEAPYKLFYGAAAPSTVEAFGVEREVAFGRTVLGILDSDAGAALRAAWRAARAAVNDALGLASRIRTDAVTAEGPVGTAESLFIDDANKEIDRLEGDLLKLFPGDRATVAAFLAPLRQGRAETARTTEDGEESEPK